MADKVHPGVLERLAHREPGETVPVIVKYSQLQAPEERMHITGLADRYVFRRLPAVAMRVSGAGLGRLNADPDVIAVWPDLEMHTMLDVSAPLLRVPEVWAESGQGTGIRVAVVDTGIDPEHPDFSGRIAAATSFVGSSADDGNGHGTHVASIIAGDGAASEGLYVGMAPEAHIYAAKVLTDSGAGLMSDVMAGVEWAVDQNVQVINLSLGSDEKSDGTDPLSELCDAAVDEGIVVCVAAGNAGPGAGTVGSPASAHKIITVGASTDDDSVADFSSRGPTKDGRTKPDVVFPGVNIVAARAAGTSMGTPVSEHYTKASGTSMATPHAAGVAALLLEGRPSLTAAELKLLLMGTALDLGLDGNTQGAGRADPYAALIGEVPEPSPEPTPEPEPDLPTPTPIPSGCLTQPLQILGLLG
jgi:serine protease AprX